LNNNHQIKYENIYNQISKSKNDPDNTYKKLYIILYILLLFHRVEKYWKPNKFNSFLRKNFSTNFVPIILPGDEGITTLYKQFINTIITASPELITGLENIISNFLNQTQLPKLTEAELR
jgi:hypothetical protein